MTALEPWMPPYPPLADRLWPAARLSRAARAAVLATLGVALLLAAAKAQVPFWPVPLTPQSLVVLLLAAAYGPALGLATVGAYLVLGALGLPVFAASPERGTGLAYMAGPTGGFLGGYVVATAVVGQLARQGWDRGFRGTLAAMAAGMATITVCGAGWLAWLAGPVEAWRGAVEPFLLVSVVQVGVASALLPLTWRVLHRRSQLF